MPHHTSDTRILDYEPLLAPAALLQELPLGQARATTIEQGRADVRAVLDMAPMTACWSWSARARSTTPPPRWTTRASWLSCGARWTTSC